VFPLLSRRCPVCDKPPVLLEVPLGPRALLARISAISLPPLPKRLRILYFAVSSFGCLAVLIAVSNSFSAAVVASIRALAALVTAALLAVWIAPNWLTARVHQKLSWLVKTGCLLNVATAFVVCDRAPVSFWAKCAVLTAMGFLVALANWKCFCRADHTADRHASRATGEVLPRQVSPTDSDARNRWN